MRTAWEREDVWVPSGGERCAAWLYRPTMAPPATDRAGADRAATDRAGTDRADPPVPVVVMAHGLGAVKEMRLDAYAERFAAAGMAALVFDYRYFGASTGEPRQLIDIHRQLQDWSAAVSFARALPGVDPQRVALWGTSFSGGHVLATAARTPGIAAVVSQCPFTDGPASMRQVPLPTAARLLVAGLSDQLRAWRGRPPRMVALAGAPGDLALMSAPDVVDGYLALIPSGLVLRETAPARIVLTLPLYRPGRDARRITCPVLFCVCDRDSVAPAGRTLRHAAACPGALVRRYPAGHFDVYVGDAFETAVADQTAFLVEHLKVG